MTTPATVQDDQCRFDEAWVGRCKNKAAGDNGMCKEHSDLKCVSCGQPATRTCDQTGIQFVCGENLCDNCTHGLTDPENPGWFNLGGGHCTKEKRNAATESERA